MPSGETISTDGGSTGGDFGGDCTVGGADFGGGVLAGLGWRVHSPAGEAVLALERIPVLYPLSASFFLVSSSVNASVALLGWAAAKSILAGQPHASLLITSR